MKKIIRTAGILTLVFAASVAVYFFAARKNMQKEEAVYSSMNAPEFPVVYTEFDGKDINALHGYIQNMVIRQWEILFLYCLKIESWQSV